MHHQGSIKPSKKQGTMSKILQEKSIWQKNHTQVFRGWSYHMPDIQNINMFKEIKYKIGKMIGEQRIKRTVIYI